MSKVIIGGGGAGGVSSDECSAVLANVEIGKSAIVKDSNDEAGVGTLRNVTADCTTELASVDSRKVLALNPASFDGIWMITNTDGVSRVCTKFAGTRGVIEPNTIIGTPTNRIAETIGATANKILAGQSICGVAGNVNVQSILSFNCAVYSSTAITFNWQNPPKGAFSGVIIVGKTGGYPTSITDGTRFQQGYGTNAAANGWSTATVSSFTPGATYYFRCFSYAIKNGVEWIHPTGLTGSAATTKGQVVLTSSGIWIVPVGVRSIEIFDVGGGGGGNSGEDRYNASASPYYSGSGGGGGYTKTWKGISVIPNQQLYMTIGLGGSGGSGAIGSQGTNGGNTMIDGMLVAEGGVGSWRDGGKGGSGGGGNAEWRPDSGANGGSNGGNGATINGSSGGTGQGTTTRAFGESNNTLYSGGGGGGAGYYMWYDSDGDVLKPNPGQGGAGGGGGGGGRIPPYQNSYRSAVVGTANTGGGGGGGWAGWQASPRAGDGANGGSGVIIIRWGY